MGDLGSIPRSGRSPGEGQGNPLQYSCLENLFFFFFLFFIFVLFCFGLVFLYFFFLFLFFCFVFFLILFFFYYFVFLPGESDRQRSLVGSNPQDHKESDITG